MVVDHRALASRVSSKPSSRDGLSGSRVGGAFGRVPRPRLRPALACAPALAYAPALALAYAPAPALVYAPAPARCPCAEAHARATAIVTRGLSLGLGDRGAV